MIYLPSTYLKFWFFYRRLNMNNSIDYLIFVICCIYGVNAVLTKMFDIIHEKLK